MESFAVFFGRSGLTKGRGAVFGGVHNMADIMSTKLIVFNKDLIKEVVNTIIICQVPQTSPKCQVAPNNLRPS